MITVDITSDIEQAEKDVADFFRRQTRYVMMRAINDTARDVQRHLRDVTIPKAWTVREPNLSGAMTTFIPEGGSGLFTTKNFLMGKDRVIIGPARSKKSGFLAGEGFAERNLTGATKVPKGSAIAIPNIGPGLKRLASGSIPTAKKPKNLRNNEKFFVKGKALYERMGANGDKLRLRYGFAAQAKGTTALARFYPDAFFVTEKVFSGHFTTAMNRAIASSRFTTTP
jgi:hypothetical protein